MIEQYLRPYEQCKPNPCDICQRNIKECPWLHEGKPVLGWDAKMISRRIKNMGRYYWSVTWAIKECPLYIAPSKKRMKEGK